MRPEADLPGAEVPRDLARLHREGFERPWESAFFADLLARPGATLVHRAEGFALAMQVLDEAEILTITTARAARRQGIGGALLGALLERLRARDVAHVFLDVAADNAPARALYARAGFVQTGLRRGYYPRAGGAVDALLLSCDLRPGQTP